MWDTRTGHKLTPDDLMDLIGPALEPLIGQPLNRREVDDAIWTAVASVLLQPESNYRVIDRDRIWAYPAHGAPEQYLMWIDGAWHWQDLPDGTVQRLLVTVSPY